MDVQINAAIIGAVIGAVAGAVGTYIARQYLAKAERKTRLLATLGMLRSELNSHLGILCMEVEGFLPAWLRRDELGNDPKIISQYLRPGLDDKYYRQFFPDLIHCNLIVRLADYYSSAEDLNRLKPEAKPYTQQEIIFIDAGLCARLLAANIDLTSRMDLEYKLTQKFPHLRDWLASPKVICRGRYLAELCKLNVTDLELLQRHLFKDYKPEKGSSDWDKLNELPELIKGDKKFVWKRYLT